MSRIGARCCNAQQESRKRFEASGLWYSGWSHTLELICGLSDRKDKGYVPRRPLQSLNSYKWEKIHPKLFFRVSIHFTRRNFSQPSSQCVCFSKRLRLRQVTKTRGGTRASNGVMSAQAQTFEWAQHLVSCWQAWELVLLSRRWYAIHMPYGATVFDLGECVPCERNTGPFCLRVCKPKSSFCKQYTAPHTQHFLACGSRLSTRLKVKRIMRPMKELFIILAHHVSFALVVV